ncbi:MAG: S41 family peptidase [Paludibacteraceae bacterium]|nr:S41 family peptidase [Paludibacteraceae bacterium]
MKHRILTLLCIALCTQCLSAKEDTYFAVAKNLDLFNSIVKELQLHYVDSIPVDKIVRAGINGMLKTLDPYTNYISAEEGNDFKYMTTGGYAGVGAIISKHGDQIVIEHVYEDTPSKREGLKAGDCILELDGKSTKGKDVEEVSSILRGTPGTNVKIKYLRYGSKKSTTIELTREHIHISSVEYAGMISEGVAYVKLKSFTENSATELKTALKQLQAQGMRNLILDLRDNPGGLITESINIANLFLPKGETVVTTREKGNKIDRVYKTASMPEYLALPLVVLVNDDSASASEIVSGALQDLDRAVIVGTRTFGKGLVQATYPLPYDGQLKVTTSKYYIPSGRCIQALNYYAADQSKNGQIPDSLTSEFKTRKGRVVRDGRGISPDIEVKNDTVSTVILEYLFEHFLFFDYVNEYCLKHDNVAPANKFVFDDNDYADFKQFVLGKNIPYTSDAEEYIDGIVEILKYENRYTTKAAADIEALRESLKPDLATELDINRKYVTLYLTSSILQRYYPQGGIEAMIPDDKVINKGIEILNDQKRYKEILSK